MLSNAENAKKSHTSENLGGYKSSAEYFETGFNSQQSAQKKTETLPVHFVDIGIGILVNTAQSVEQR